MSEEVEVQAIESAEAAENKVQDTNIRDLYTNL